MGSGYKRFERVNGMKFFIVTIAINAYGKELLQMNLPIVDHTQHKESGRVEKNSQIGIF